MSALVSGVEKRQTMEECSMAIKPKSGIAVIAVVTGIYAKEGAETGRTGRAFYVDRTVVGQFKWGPHKQRPTATKEHRGPSTIRIAEQLGRFLVSNGQSEAEVLKQAEGFALQQAEILAQRDFQADLEFPTERTPREPRETAITWLDNEPPAFLASKVKTPTFDTLVPRVQ